MINSFRLRIALLSALLTGIALIAFSLSIWWLVRDIKIERIDSDIRTTAERETGRTRSPAEWQRMEAAFVSNLGVRDPDDLLLLVEDGAGEITYRSSRWPARLDSAQLPWPAPPAAQQPRRPPPAAEAGTLNSAQDLPLPPLKGERRPRPGPPQRPPFAESPPPDAPPATAVISQSADGHVWRIGLAATERTRVAIAVDARVVDAEMKSMRNAILIAVPLVIILIALGAMVFSSRALRPLKTLTAATQRMTAEGLDQRLSVAGEDREFVELIEVFNRMLARLERSFKQACRFSADAAHELKTPLAVLQGQLERAIAKAEDGSPMQAELTSILDEVRRLSTISRKLLLLSQADAGRLTLYREPLDLSKALADLVEDTHMMAPDLQVTSEIQANLTIAADSSLLHQVLHNLIANAIKYNVDQGWIRISTTRSGQQVEITVANSSTGIPAAEQEKIFERFYRADRAHSRHIDGVGLGLSVSREIARAHGGDITLKTNTGGKVEFSLILPATAPNKG